MMRGLYTRSARRSYLVRGVAVFFVLFVFFDLAFPQLCQEAADGIPSRIHAPAQAADGEPDASDRAAAKDSGDTRPDRQPERESHEEDCLGCCAHVLMGDMFTPVAVAETVSLPAPPVDAQVPTPSLRNPYHPPRIS